MPNIARTLRWVAPLLPLAIGACAKAPTPDAATPPVAVAAAEVTSDTIAQPVVATRHLRAT